jgi:hypothetical protein
MSRWNMLASNCETYNKIYFRCYVWARGCAIGTRLVCLPCQNVWNVYPSIFPSILRPSMCPGLPQNAPPFVSTPSRFLHPRIPRICSTFCVTTSSHLVLGVPTDLLLWNFPLRIFFWMLSSSILLTGRILALVSSVSSLVLQITVLKPVFTSDYPM